MSTNVDFAHTQQAERNRVTKAHTIARWLFDQAIDDKTLFEADPNTRRAWARAAGVVPPHTMDTWYAARDALAVLEEWAASNPGHPKAARAHTPSVEEAEEVAAEREATVTALRPATEPPVFAPRDWDAVVAAGPIDRKDARCSQCGAAAVAAVPQSGRRTEWRCANHPPQPGEWGDELDWTPKDDLRFHQDGPHRCFNDRCHAYQIDGQPTPRSASALLDERAAANGKNRAPVHVRQAAREAEERRKEANKAHRAHQPHT